MGSGSNWNSIEKTVTMQLHPGSAAATPSGGGNRLQQAAAGGSLRPAEAGGPEARIRRAASHFHIFLTVLLRQAVPVQRLLLLLLWRRLQLLCEGERGSRLAGPPASPLFLQAVAGTQRREVGYGCNSMWCNSNKPSCKLGAFRLPSAQNSMRSSNTAKLHTWAAG